MRKTVINTAIVVILTSVALTIFVKLTSRGEQVLNYTNVKKGKFEITVSATGELIAENSIDIKGPDIVQNMNFRSGPIKITDLVPEGTIVKKGNYIGSLDKTNFINTLKDETTNLKTIQANLEMKILDTAVILATLRDDILNQESATEEAQIVLEQARFESPAVKRQALLELERSQRFLSWKKRLYYLRYVQSRSEVINMKRSFEKQLIKVKDLENVLAGFTIQAPADGMIIYKKDYLGNKIISGSFVSPFNPVVATLPDLSSMISRIYISEIDINKVKPGQPVQVKVDAFNEKSYTGKVFNVANIGEQLVNSDSKVFEVQIKVEGSNQLLKPTMTTGNRVITKTFENVLYVPIESVQTGTDSVPFVYTKNGVRQVVLLGEANEKHIIIESGLTEGTPVYLSTPENSSKFVLAGNDLIKINRERERAKKLDLEKTRLDHKLLTEAGQPPSKSFSISSGQSGSGGTEGEF